MRWLSVVSIWIGLASTGAPCLRAATVAITAPQVAAAAEEAGMPVSAQQVGFLSQVVATLENPELMAVRADLWGNSQAMVLMRCRNSGQCIPFYVALKWPDAAAAAQALRNSNLPSGITGSAVNLRPAVQASHPAEPAVVRRGDAATLVIEGERMRMELPVICMQDGGVGARIRVMSADRKKNYVAEVVSPKFLKLGM